MQRLSVFRAALAGDKLLIKPAWAMFFVAILIGVMGRWFVPAGASPAKAGGVAPGALACVVFMGKKSSLHHRLPWAQSALRSANTTLDTSLFCLAVHSHCLRPHASYQPQTKDFLAGVSGSYCGGANDLACAADVHVFQLHKTAALAEFVAHPDEQEDGDANVSGHYACPVNGVGQESVVVLAQRNN